MSWPHCLLLSREEWAPHDVNNSFTKPWLNRTMANESCAALRLLRRGCLAAGFGAVAVFGLTYWEGIAFAQSSSRPDQRAGADAAAARASRQQELETLEAERKKSEEAAAKLKAEVSAIGEDRRKLNQALIATAARIRDIEQRMSAGENRIRKLESDAERVRASLESRRTETAELLAALQRMGRRPPPVILVRPEDALEAVRAAMLLGAILPDMRKDIEALAADLHELARVRKSADGERDAMARDLAALAAERQRISALETQRRGQQTETERALDVERAKAAGLARRSGDLKELIGSLEKEVAAAARAAEAAAKAELKTSIEPPATVAALKDSGRLMPAIAFASAKGLLPLPVNGVRVREFGSADGLGGLQRGLSIATRASAQVTAPCDGWVVYAGPFRSYGQLLILNAGGGYHVLLAGMERISVDLGQFVLTGEPVAVMGGGPQAAAAVAIGSSQPVLYVEFRKDGAPVDPGPWWATTDNEKVRG